MASYYNHLSAHHTLTGKKVARRTKQYKHITWDYVIGGQKPIKILDFAPPEVGANVVGVQAFEIWSNVHKHNRTPGIQYSTTTHTF